MTLSTQAKAEPSAEVQTLMNRPVSMLDWGLYHLEDLFFKDGHKVFINYNWDENTIVIGYFMHGAFKSSSSMEEVEDFCKTKYNDFDSVLTILNGQNIIPEFCSWCQFFSHNGWTSDSLRGATEKLKDRIYYVSYSDSHICRRKVYGTTISVSKK
jgi:hypothetical protein